MVESMVKGKTSVQNRLMTAWFEELTLPVAPACNMMCSFCSRDSDCICNANNPRMLSRVMTPRQAVKWAVAQTEQNRRIKVIRISGPGEPLYNKQTFEVLKRLNAELPLHTLSISTNGLLLKERMDDLLRLNVRQVEVSLNAVHSESARKLYSRIIKDENVITSAGEITNALLESQMEGLRLCVKNGMEVKINTIYFPEINREDVVEISDLCRELGVKSMRLIPTLPSGKLRTVRVPTLGEMAAIYEVFARKVGSVEIKSFAN
jgi:nitrogen fixation protein NifB